MQVMVYILYLCGVFLLPFPPAYVMFKCLPSKATVRGPFKGLRIDLTGAFAGYFLLVLMAFGFAYYVLMPSQPSYEVWRVKGKVTAKSIDPNTGSEINNVLGATIEEDPSTYTIGSGGDFEMQITVKPGLAKGQKFYPTLKFNQDGYTSWVLVLNVADVEINEEAKAIMLKQPIILERLKETTEEPQWTRDK